MRLVLLAALGVAAFVNSARADWVQDPGGGWIFKAEAESESEFVAADGYGGHWGTQCRTDPITGRKVCVRVWIPDAAPVATAAVATPATTEVEVQAAVNRPRLFGGVFERIAQRRAERQARIANFFFGGGCCR